MAKTEEYHINVFDLPSGKRIEKIVFENVRNNRKARAFFSDVMSKVFKVTEGHVLVCKFVRVTEPSLYWTRDGGHGARRFFDTTGFGVIRPDGSYDYTPRRATDDPDPVYQEIRKLMGLDNWIRGGSNWEA